MNQSIAVVIPTIRPLKALELCRILSDQTGDVRLTIYIIEDGPCAEHPWPDEVKYFCWDDIDDMLASRSWIIPRQTDCVRSFGFWRAWADGADIIISLDDDCFPGPGFFTEHIKGLSSRFYPGWVNTLEGLTARGVPYDGCHKAQDIRINLGLWDGVPDLDFMGQLTWERMGRPTFTARDQYVPFGQYYPMSGMNVAFDRTIAPAMYFMLMGKNWPYHRFGDIWAGIVSKKICDHLGWGIHIGKPIVRHERASNVWKNMELESCTLRANEDFWRAIDDIPPLHRGTVGACYREIVNHFPLTSPYWSKLREAMWAWIDLFTE